MLKDRLDHVHVVIHSQLIGDGQQNGVGFGDGFILFKLFHQRFGICGVAAAENGAGLLIEITDFVAVIAAGAKIPQ
jgi:hypothetical protein